MAEPEAGAAAPDGEPKPDVVGKGQPKEDGDVDVKKKLGDAMKTLDDGVDHLCDKLGDAVDKAISKVDEGLEKVDNQVDEKGCCHRCIKSVRSVRDPVTMGRCSPFRILFILIMLAAFGVAGWSASDDPPDVWEMTCGIFVALLAGFIGIFLGGDIFMIKAFQAVVNKIQTQIDEFRKHNDELTLKMDRLGHVEEGLQSVYDQMGGDLNATASLLTDMERYSSLQTVSAVTNQFYASDYDGSGVIKGEEATLLIPQLVILWELVPSFDQTRFEEKVRTSGLTLAELSLLLEVIVSEDRPRCLRELEAICSPKGAVGGDVEMGAVGHTLEAEATHGAAAPYDDVNVGGGDIELGYIAPPRQMRPTVAHFAEPAPEKKPAWSGTKASLSEEGEGEEKKKKGALEPLCSVPICAIGPLSAGTISIWGYFHLALLLTVPIALALFLQQLLTEGASDVVHLTLAIIGLSLAIALSLAGRLLEVLRVLRKQLKELTVENQRSEELNQIMEKKVTHLASLKTGFEKLQGLCQGNVEKAKELIRKSNTKIRCEAMAVVTHLFRTSDKNKDMKLSANELDAFVESLGLVFRTVPGFDADKIRQSIGSEVTSRDMKAVVELITAFDQSADVPADGSALRDQADAALDGPAPELPGAPTDAE